MTLIRCIDDKVARSPTQTPEALKGFNFESSQMECDYFCTGIQL